MGAKAFCRYTQTSWSGVEMSTQLSGPVRRAGHLRETRGPSGSCKKVTMPSDYEKAHLLLDFLVPGM